MGKVSIDHRTEDRSYFQLNVDKNLQYTYLSPWHMRKYRLKKRNSNTNSQVGTTTHIVNKQVKMTKYHKDYNTMILYK